MMTAGLAEKIGPYVVLGELGRGGMGIVYRGRHAVSGRPVAIKTAAISSRVWLERLRCEIGALRHIRHPAVVRIRDDGVHEGRPWYAMDLLEGETLRHFADRLWSPYRARQIRVPSTARVTRTEALRDDSPALHDLPPLPPFGADLLPPAAAGELPTVLGLVSKVSLALGFLHGEGLVNSDLKPANVMLTGGQPVLIDFGLAMRHPGGSGREAIEPQPARFGSVPYMSPEQVRGELLDARSDVYSVGCVLYELLTGDPPFKGSSLRAVMAAHEATTPLPPSELVSGVPPLLDELVLRLLAKDPSARIGYAEEIAVALAELEPEAQRPASYPPSRPYLYRPQFADRIEVLARLMEARGRCLRGRRVFVLLGGESGAGKTRLAMELTRQVAGAGMHVVVTEFLGTPHGSQGRASAVPLEGLRPLLRAVADRCIEGGPAVTRCLLGNRRAVLGAFEPTLADLPDDEQPGSPPAMPAGAARLRLFVYLAQTLRAFAQEQPLCWVLDDIQWADELTLDFLAWAADREWDVPVMVLATYRTEEASECIERLGAVHWVESIRLPPLPDEAVSSMVRDMLALRGHAEAFIRFVTRHGEGNPFFVTEHVRTAVSERIVYRDAHAAWQLKAGEDDGTGSYETLPVPLGVQAHLQRRLAALTKAAQHIARVAAAVGREAELEVVYEAAGFSEALGVGAVGELLRREVFEQLGPQSVRFVHDRLREAAEAMVTEATGPEMHARIAAAMASRWGNKPEAAGVSARLGRHYEAALAPAPAARHFKRAADHARSLCAHGEAARLYRDALRNIDRTGPWNAAERSSWELMSADCYEGLGEALALAGRRPEARDAYAKALRRHPADSALARARIHRRMGKTWEWEYNVGEALASYDRALVEAPGPAKGESPGSEWLTTELQRLYVLYFFRRLPELKAGLAYVEPLVHAHGSPTQRSLVQQGRVMADLLEHAWKATEQTVQHGYLAVLAAEGTPDTDRATAVFAFGFSLLLHGQLDDAERQLTAALALTERAGDVSLRARCLAYLALGARMSRREAWVETLSLRTCAVAQLAGTKPYEGLATANRAWLALRRGDLEQARRLGRQAVAIWAEQDVGLGHVYPFQWTALAPLLACAVAENDAPLAADCFRRLAGPWQHRLPFETAGPRDAAQASDNGAEILARARAGLAAIEGSQFE